MAKMGRPTKLTDELLLEARQYLDSTTSIGVQFLLPTIEGLALKLDVHKDTLYQWEEENQDFSDVLRELRNAQAEKLMQNSLQNRYNPTIAKLLLSKHGYIEQKQTDITTKGEALNALSEEERSKRSEAIDQYLEHEE